MEINEAFLNKLFLNALGLTASLLLSGFIAHIFIQWRKKPSLIQAGSSVYRDILQSYHVATNVILPAKEMNFGFYFPMGTFDITFKYLMENGRFLQGEATALSVFQNIATQHNKYLDHYFNNYKELEQHEEHFLTQTKGMAAKLQDHVKNELIKYTKFRRNPPEYSLFYNVYADHQIGRKGQKRQ